MKKSIQISAVVAVWVSLVQASEACTVCMGGDGTIGEAANGAIFVMLGVLAAVLGFISSIGYLIVRKGQMPLPPHAELVRSLSGVHVD
jgi:flagellar biogenesis protein FliO